MTKKALFGRDSEPMSIDEVNAVRQSLIDAGVRTATSAEWQAAQERSAEIDRRGKRR